MNRYYNYKNMDLWAAEKWSDRVSPLFGLAKWFSLNCQSDDREYTHPVDDVIGSECSKLSCYFKKPNCVAAPDVTEYWEARGLNFVCRSIGGIPWFVMAPSEAFKNHETKLPALIIFCRSDFSDPYWAMKLIEDNKGYFDMAANEKVIITCINVYKPVFDRAYVNIIQEAFTLLPADTNRVYLDISAVISTDCKMKDIPEFIYRDKNGDIADPDESVEYFSGLNLPVLDISKRWEDSYSLGRDQVNGNTYVAPDFDKGHMIHSMTGKKLAESIKLEYDFMTPYETGIVDYWRELGIKSECHDYKGQRWISLVPMCALDKGDEKIPLLIGMQEVNYSNDHLSVTSEAYFHEFGLLAAQGDFILVLFALEDADSNDMICDIIKEAERMYPVDLERVYIAGHSHNGRFSNEFAIRHPELIAAVATMGNCPGLLPAEVMTGEPVLYTDEKIEKIMKTDMPLINLSGVCEHNCYFPVGRPERDIRRGHNASRETDKKNSILAWQRRLKAYNCPMKTFEEIDAAADSEDYVTRILGIPNDRNQVLYFDGFEHYIADIKNNDGNYHLRIVGIQGMPHIPTAMMMDLAWSFMRRFARDKITGKIKELY